MKKIISILLIFILVCSFCACGKDSGNEHNNPPVNPPSPPGGGQTNPVNPSDPTDPGHNINPTEFHREDAIQPPAVPSVLRITDAALGDVILTHVNLTSFPDSSETLLNLAYEALESVFVKANVSAMYFVPLGLAGLYSSFDPIMIVTDSELLNSDPIFMVPLRNADGYTLMGTFFASDVEENSYLEKCADVHNFFVNTLLSKNGLLDKNIQVQFNGEMLNGLDLKPISKEFTDLFDAANGRMLAFFTGDVISDDGWSNTDADGRCKVDLYNLKSISDLKKWLGEYFDEELVTAAMNKTDSYVEKNGALWAYPAGIGDNMSIEKVHPKFMAQKNDTTAVLIVELTRIEYDESWDNIKGRHFEEYYFELTKTAKGWIFSNYQDIFFGFI